MRRLIIILPALLFVVGPWSAAGAQEEAPPDEGVVVEEPTFEPGREPAVVLDTGTEAVADDAWTFRYLAPTLLAMATLVLLAVILHYGFRVRGRYRVVR